MLTTRHNVSSSSCFLFSHTATSCIMEPKPSAFISAAQHIDALSNTPSASNSEQTTTIIRSILKGIQNIMIYNAKKTHNINIYMNSKDQINIDDEKLKEECLSSTKIKQENNEFEFEEYAHLIFDLLRRQFDLKSFKYLYKLFGIELCNPKKGHKNMVDIELFEYATKHFWKSLITNSASGQLFYRSKDNLFIIKQVKQNEWNFLRQSFLFHYFRHIQANKDSLLTKILGLYRINNIYFIIMKNIYYAPLHPLQMHKVYDLKGSTHKRQATRHKLVVDTFDIATLSVITSTSSLCDIDDVMTEKFEEEEKETFDNLRHAYSPSMYQPTMQDELAKIKTLRLDSFDDNDRSKKSLKHKESVSIGSHVWITCLESERFAKYQAVFEVSFLQQNVDGSCLDEGI
eukprot:107717_1